MEKCLKAVTEPCSAHAVCFKHGQRHEISIWTIDVDECEINGIAARRQEHPEWHVAQWVDREVALESLRQPLSLQPYADAIEEATEPSDQPQAKSTNVATATSITGNKSTTMNPSFHVDAERRKHIVRAAFFDPASMRAYCWKSHHSKNLDFPGGMRLKSDLNDSQTILRECDNQVSLPWELRHRLITVSGHQPPYRMVYNGGESDLHSTTLVSVWFVRTTPEELTHISQTKEGTRRGMGAGLKPLFAIGASSPFAAAITAGLYDYGLHGPLRRAVDDR